MKGRVAAAQPVDEQASLAHELRERAHQLISVLQACEAARNFCFDND